MAALSTRWIIWLALLVIIILGDFCHDCVKILHFLNFCSYELSQNY